MKVQIVYRNYKPLHDMYASLKILPPPGVSYIYPLPKTNLRKLYPLYLQFGDNWLFKKIISQAQKIFFETRDYYDSDVLHYMQMLPKRNPSTPFVIDFEHIISLANFVSIDQNIKEKITRCLCSSQCRKIIPLSFAALKTLQNLMGYKGLFSEKVEVIYPALPDYASLFGDHAVKRVSDKLNLLFVGNSPYKKGLHELLAAFHALEQKFNDIYLTVISDASPDLQKKYDLKQIRFLPPKFSHDEIISQFYLQSDLFVMPTHDDTFGMAMLYALACGCPVITTKQFATPEMITPGENGYFVTSQRLHLEEVPFPSRNSTKLFHLYGKEEKIIVDDLIDRISFLYQNRDHLKRLQDNANRNFKPGAKFSIEHRNNNLIQVYNSCTNDALN